MERELREAEAAENVRKLQAMSGDRSNELQRLKAARDEAAWAQARLEQQATEQQAALERLRAARNGSALERQRVLEEELREAKRRRTLNQRRISDANLADRRARAAEGRAAEAQAWLGEFAIEDEDVRQRAAIADELEVQVSNLQTELQQQRETAAAQLAAREAALTSQLDALRQKTQAELAAQKAELDRLRAIAEPSKERFKKGNHFSAAADLSIVQVLSLGIARKKVEPLAAPAAPSTHPPTVRDSTVISRAIAASTCLPFHFLLPCSLTPPVLPCDRWSRCRSCTPCSPGYLASSYPAERSMCPAPWSMGSAPTASASCSTHRVRRIARRWRRSCTGSTSCRSASGCSST